MTNLHKHHIIPRHAGGTDEPSNLVNLTVEEHAEAHRRLWEEYGRMEDWYAWQGLSGIVGKDDILQGLRSSPQQKEKISLGVRRQWSEGRGNIDQTKMKAAKLARYGVENVVQIQVECQHCGKTGQYPAMRRWHFDNCKNRL